jgi:hypothetical protein
MTFTKHQDVAVVEHDDQTRQPREGGRRFNATVTSAEGIYLAVRYNDDQQGLGVVGHRTGQFYAESGWRAWDGEFRWRLVPVCRCESPILGESVKDPDDPTGEEFCGDDCLTTAAEASHGAFAGTEFN